MEIKDRIKAFRKSQKQTQAEFGSLLGCGRDTIANYETGRVAPPEPFLQLLCSKFHLSDEWLRNGTGEMKQETEDTLFGAFAAQYDLSPEEQTLARYLLELTSEERQLVLNHVLALADAIRQNQQSPAPRTVNFHITEDMTPEKRAELHRQLDDAIDAEKKVASVSCSGN